MVREVKFGKIYRVRWWTQVRTLRKVNIGRKVFAIRSNLYLEKYCKQTKKWGKVKPDAQHFDLGGLRGTPQDFSRQV